MLKIIPSLSIFCLAISTASCSQKTVQLDTVLNANQCGFAQQNLVYISSDKQLRQLFKQRFNSPIKKLDNIDFTSSALILVSMGQQPSSGYSIQLKSPDALVKNNTLSIDINFKKPSADSFNAQILTSPCALYKIDKQIAHTVILK